MSKFVNFISKYKGHLFVALLPLVLIVVLQVAIGQLSAHKIPKPIHRLSDLVSENIILFALLHIVILSGVYVYLTQQIAKILSKKKFSELEQQKLLNLRFWFLGSVVVLESVFILQVFL